MRLDDLMLKCYAERERDGSWFAVCIDLNLVAQGESLDSVKIKLHQQVRDYLEEAVTDDAAYFGDLIPRPAPLSFRLKFYLLELICKLRHNRLRNNSNHGGACPFTDFLPLKPA